MIYLIYHSSLCNIIVNIGNKYAFRTEKAIKK